MLLSIEILDVLTTRQKNVIDNKKEQYRYRTTLWTSNFAEVLPGSGILIYFALTVSPESLFFVGHSRPYPSFRNFICLTSSSTSVMLWN